MAHASNFAALGFLQTVLLLFSIISGTHGEEACTFGRLFLSDGLSPKVAVIDLDTGSEVYAMPDNAAIGSGNAPALYPTSDARHVYVNYRAAQGVVRIIRIGIAFESHGDHVDVLKEKPTLLGLNITGDMPTHFATGHQKTVIFFDGRRDSTSRVLGFVDTDLSGVGIREPFNYGPMDPQHGSAVPLANHHFAVSQPNPGYKAGTSNDSLSIGFSVVDKDGKTIYSMNEVGNPAKSCPSFHGHASYGDVSVFGCSGGFLSLTHVTSANSFTSRQVKYHDSGRRTGTFFKHDRQPVIVGQHSGGTPAQYSLVRWTAGTEYYDAMRDVLDFGAVRPCSAGFELALGKSFVTLLTNGSLMVYDIASGWLYRNSVAAADAFTCSGASHPRMALGYHRVFLLFPSKKEVVEYRLSLSTLTKGRSFTTSVQPSTGVVSGLSSAVSASLACPHDVVLSDAEKVAAPATGQAVSNTTSKSPACRLIPGHGARLLLSAYMLGGLAAFRALYAWSLTSD